MIFFWKGDAQFYAGHAVLFWHNGAAEQGGGGGATGGVPQRRRRLLGALLALGVIE